MKRSIICSVLLCLCLTLFYGCGANPSVPGGTVGTDGQTTPAPTEMTTAPAETTVPVETTAAPTETQVQYETKAVYLLVRSDTKFFDGNGPIGAEYEYDEYGRVIKRWNLADGARNGNSTEYEYDEQGRKIKEITHNAEYEVLCGYHLYFYDDNGRLVKDTSYQMTDEVSYESVYTYDEAGWLISDKVTWFSKDPDSVSEEITEYNEDHTQGTRYDYRDGVKNAWYEVETYDADGRIIKLDRVNEDGTWGSSRDYFYDDQGRIIREEYNTSSQMQSDYDVIYTYDENGLLIKKLVDYYYGDETTYTYELREILVPVTG